jgi:Outer membrane protein beta-barrel domain
MNSRHSIVLVCLLLFGTVVLAQDYAKVEVPVNYSYMRFNPENGSTVSSFSMNGGGGGVAVYVNDWLGIQGEFEGYATAGTKTFNFAGTSALCPTGCIVSANGNLFTYNVGPIIKHRSEHFEPFVEMLFGGAHTNTYGNVLKACQLNCQTSAAPSNNAWSYIFGGGIDIPISKSIAIRPAQLDYVLTRFQSAFTTEHRNQQNFRYQAGVVLRF